MKISAVTIEREYGSGGTEVARLLARKVGIPCYGREILEEVSKRRNISVNDIEKYEEGVTNSFLYSLYVMAKASSGNSNMLTEEGHIFVDEQAVIRQFAKNGPAVFLGHCAAEALKEQNDVLHVFICCKSASQKRKRILEEYGIPEAKAENVRKRFNKKRANYYYANTSRKWDDYTNYDMILDSAALGTDGCAAAMSALFNV